MGVYIITGRLDCRTDPAVHSERAGKEGTKHLYAWLATLIDNKLLGLARISLRQRLPQPAEFDPHEPYIIAGRIATVSDVP
jgi:hypothetical protein